MKNFDFMDKMIDKVLLALFVLALLIFFFACSNKVTLFSEKELNLTLRIVAAQSE